MDPLPRAQASGPALIRLLARISGADTAAPSQTLSARLSQWIDWRQAVALSAALAVRPEPPSAGSDASVEENEAARVRALLTGAIEGDRAFAAIDPPAVLPDATFYRQRYVALQQTMEAEIGYLRGRLRDRLAQRGASMQRLAAVDAVMEQALGQHERALLAPFPMLLATHFDRLRPDPHETPAVRGASSPVSAPWHDAFRRDMKSLLLAELDLRLHPAQGLLAALRTNAPEPHAQ